MRCGAMPAAAALSACKYTTEMVVFCTLSNDLLEFAPMNDTAKLDSLHASLRDLGSALVAFSAGVDSTFLLRVAHEELGERCVAATVRAPFVPAHEFGQAVSFCRGPSGTPAPRAASS